MTPFARFTCACLLALPACGGPEANLYPREPRRPEEEGWVAPAQPIAMAKSAEQEEQEKRAAQGRLIERREKGGGGAAFDVFGEAGVRTQIAALEGVWLVRDLQFPGRTRPVSTVDGLAVACGDHLHLLLMGEGQSEYGRETIFQSGAYRMLPDLSGKISLQPEGGFSNLGPFIRSIETKQNERDPAMDPRPRSEVGRTQDPPVGSGLTRGLENPRAEDQEKIALRFFGQDRVRLEREQNYWIELDRKTTNRLVAVRQSRFLQKVRVEDPDGKRPLESRSLPKELEAQRLAKRDIQGHWAVVELYNAKKDPTRSRQGGGWFTFVDGTLVYQLTLPVSSNLGRESTGFQLGVRRYAVSESQEVLLEDAFGLLSVEGQGSYGVRRLPVGNRTRMRLFFESESRLRLEHAVDNYVVLERVARPRFVEQELAAEALEVNPSAGKDAAKTELDLSGRKRPR
ncbi:MAG: hypothetical protein IPN34_15620 [Planctomycetes bacterium]|nr:hypothetical protein [Planctomycetota bacterium]